MGIENRFDRAVIHGGNEGRIELPDDRFGYALRRDDAEEDADVESLQTLLVEGRHIGQDRRPLDRRNAERTKDSGLDVRG